MTRFAAALILAFALAGPALAGQSVSLRPDVGVRDGRVTLADVFDGAGAAGSVVLASAPAGSNIVLDAGRVKQVAYANGLDWNNAQGVRRIIARADGGSSPADDGAAPARASAPAARAVSVLAYARDISTGETLRADDLVWSHTAVAGGDAPRDSDLAIGQAARRPLRAGSAVAMRDLSRPQVIKANDTISVAYEADGVRLVLQAKAMSAAAVGETFNAVNPGSKKVIQAVAVGPGEAVVGPAAEQARGDPQLYAALR